VGTGQARMVMMSYLGRESPVDPHNSYLYTGVQYGFPGLIAFAVLLVSVLISGLRVHRDESLPATYRAFGLATVGFVGALAVCNLFYANLYKSLVLGSVTLHLGMVAFVQAEHAAALEGEASWQHDESLDEPPSLGETAPAASSSWLGATAPSRPSRT
jgi:hypothetical protein